MNRHLKLSELTQRIQKTIEQSFGNQLFWVVADVTNHTFKLGINVHYFDLVEKDAIHSAILAKISSRAWGTGASKISEFEKLTAQRFQNNIHVLVLVSVDFSKSYGLQLNLHEIDASFTLGHFEQQKKATLSRLLLQNTGYVSLEDGIYQSRNKTLRLNRVLQKIALITSDTSAGYQDFKNTIETNTSGYKFQIHKYFTLVQGESNAKLMVNKLIEIYASGIPFDAVVILRGGGAQTDFLIFDSYILSRAIARFPIPIITGIGHHKNETISDLMAHTATNTPTKAAEFILACNRQFEENLLSVQQKLIIKTQSFISGYNEDLNFLKSNMAENVFRILHGHQRLLSNFSGTISGLPKMIVSHNKEKLAMQSSNLKLQCTSFLSAQTIKIQHFSTIMNIMDPQNILKRGFALLMVDGKIINNASTLHEGTKLMIQMESEEITTRVSSKRKSKWKI